MIVRTYINFEDKIFIWILSESYNSRRYCWWKEMGKEWVWFGSASTTH